MGDYKSAFEPGPRPGRGVTWLLAVLLLFGGGLAVDRWLLPHPVPAAAPSSSVHAPLSASRWSATTRGAGDAAAWLESRLAATAALPAGERREQVAGLLAADATPGLLDRLVVAGDEPAGGIRQTVVARIWADRANDPAQLPIGTRVRVQSYGLALLGSAGDGVSAPTASLTGGWAVHDLTVQLTSDGWRLAEVQPPVPAPGPNLRGASPDGAARDMSLLTRVLGPDSWAPETQP
ncbi:hypothetical protein AB0M46_13730 [Dactylosporangium sp. NPDC051485]|uniref:hypothetical protein n=1 Tax=Dactylosporangium sp. NPDC051485 TaxID=3154846 RepID=UPI00343B0797